MCYLCKRIHEKKHKNTKFKDMRYFQKWGEGLGLKSFKISKEGGEVYPEQGWTWVIKKVWRIREWGFKGAGVNSYISSLGLEMKF